MCLSPSARTSRVPYREALNALQASVIAYGKGAIVGTSGDIEHAAAIIYPRMGKPMREAIGGGQAIIPSNIKIGTAGAFLDVPLGHKDDVWSFDQIDTMTLSVPGAPRRAKSSSRWLSLMVAALGPVFQKQAPFCRPVVDSMN